MVCDKARKPSNTSSSSRNNTADFTVVDSLRSYLPCNDALFNDNFCYKFANNAAPSKCNEDSDNLHDRSSSATTQFPPSARKLEVRITTLEEFEEFFGGPLSVNKKSENKASPNYEACQFDSFFCGSVNALSIVNDLQTESEGSQTSESQTSPTSSCFATDSEADSHAKASAKVAPSDTQSPRSAEWNESLLSSSTGLFS